MVFDTVYQLDLYDTLFAPLISRGLISLGKLDSCEFYVKFNSGSLNLYKHYGLCGSCFLIVAL